MKIIAAKWILLMDEAFGIVEDGAICFDERIIAVDGADQLKSRYPQSEFEDFGDAVIMPGLINAHTHLEFSANRSQLRLGSFVGWLESVIEKREGLLAQCEAKQCIDRALDTILESGTTTIGAISSFGLDMESCSKSPINVIYFNEILGSNPAVVDTMYGEFLERYEQSRAFASKSFLPAISVHSPYSTHPILIRKVLETVKAENLVVSTHFMESKDERAWLDRGEGRFAEFFKAFVPDPKPLIKPLEYIGLFKGVSTIYTHCAEANEAEIEAILAQDQAITHCPRSNRYLGSSRLEIEKLPAFHLATDGLSSNDSLSMWDEMRGALMLHSDLDLADLAKRLLLGSTREAGRALGLQKGVIKEGYESDLIVVPIPAETEESMVAISLILHTQKVEGVYVGGERI